MTAAVEVTSVKREDILCRVASECFFVTTSTTFFVRLPVVVRFGPGGKPVVKNFDIRMSRSDGLGELGDSVIAETSYEI